MALIEKSLFLNYLISLNDNFVYVVICLLVLDNQATYACRNNVKAVILNFKEEKVFQNKCFTLYFEFKFFTIENF